MFLTPPRPHASHRLSRPTSGLLPEIAVSDDNIPLTPKLSDISASRQGSNETGKIHEDEQAVAAQETQEGEQPPISETVHTNGEATQTGESAQAGENTQAGGSAQAGKTPHEGETANEDKASRKSDTEAQASEVMQDPGITSRVEADNEGGLQHENGMNAQAAQGMQAGEEPQKGETVHETNTGIRVGK